MAVLKLSALRELSLLAEVASGHLVVAVVALAASLPLLRTELTVATQAQQQQA